MVLGMGLGGLTYQPVQQLAKITNFEYRFLICCWCSCCSVVIVVELLLLLGCYCCWVVIIVVLGMGLGRLTYQPV